MTSIGFIEGMTSRPPFAPDALVGLTGGMCVAAFSSVGWLMTKLNCTEAQARQFKVNAQVDFESLLQKARIAKALLP